MRRAVVAIGILLVLTGLGACTEDDPGADPSADPAPAETSEPEVRGEPIDPEAARDRLSQICRRTVAATDYDSCLARAEAAIDQAIGAGCPLPALDAWAEHGVAWSFTSLPGAEFFERCRIPLSNLVLRSVPEPYVASSAAGVGLLDTAGMAAGFGDPAEVERFLGRLDHQVSYAAVWVDGDDLVLVRLDRFAQPEQAAAFLDSDHYPVDTDDRVALEVPGILQGRVQESPGAHLVTGRVCEVVMTMHAQEGADGSIDGGVVLDWFRDQARRIQSAVTC